SAQHKDPAAEAQTWFERGLSSEEASDSTQALEAYERCRQLDVRHAAARINLGRLLHESGRYEEAQRVYREALRECEPDLLCTSISVCSWKMSRATRRPSKPTCRPSARIRILPMRISTSRACMKAWASPSMRSATW